ncbi:MAG: FAD-dependent monooxygenase [Rhodanobacteraceae bacterium]|nr:FAD-dependent monooxygenase [Rhodanobacteraceae bacterium]
METDILIAGGGLVGLSLALALSGSGLRVTLVDRQPLGESARGADERHLALSEVSCRILDALDVLPLLGADAEPIRAIHVSSAGEFGAVRWAARDSGRERFGMIAPARRLLLALQRAVQARPDLEVIAPAAVVQAVPGADHIVAILEGAANTRCNARLLVIADGVESQPACRYGHRHHPP